jgi:beta-glucanase (GH16 family)
MGNLGRAGYGATSDGLWPYTYDACDVGTLPNQTLNGAPIAATNTGIAPQFDYALSYLPGMRLSSCTCPGEQHPGPVHQDGTFVARSAPEIDVLECGLAFLGDANKTHDALTRLILSSLFLFSFFLFSASECHYKHG